MANVVAAILRATVSLARADSEGEATEGTMGGRVAMEVARQAPTRVTRLVLANTGHHPLKAGEKEKRQAKPPALLTQAKQGAPLGHQSASKR